MAPFDRPYTTFYWSAIVNIALSATVFELFDVEWYHELEIWVRGHNIIQSGTVRKFGCGFLFAFHSNYGSISHQFRDKARYWSKIVIFHTPLHSTPPLGGGGSCRNIAIPFGTEKLEWWGYPMMEKTLRICITVYAQYRRVTDRQTDDWQTDRRTDILPRHSPDYAYASRGKNCTLFVFAILSRMSTDFYNFWHSDTWINFQQY